MELPEQLLLLQGEALVALALLLQRLLQDRLLRGKLPGNCHVLVHLSCKFFMLLLELLQFVPQCCVIVHQFLHLHSLDVPLAQPLILDLQHSFQTF